NEAGPWASMGSSGGPPATNLEPIAPPASGCACSKTPRSTATFSRAWVDEQADQVAARGDSVGKSRLARSSVEPWLRTADWGVTSPTCAPRGTARTRLVIRDRRRQRFEDADPC